MFEYNNPSLLGEVYSKMNLGCTWVETAQGALHRQVLWSRACKAEENLSAKPTECSFNTNVKKEVAKYPNAKLKRRGVLGLPPSWHWDWDLQQMLLKTNTVSFTTNMILINRKIPLLEPIGSLDIENFSSILLRGIVIGNMTQVNPSEPKWTQVKPQQQQTGSNWSKLVQTGHYWFNQTGSNWSKRVKTGPNCLIWSNIAHNGSKWRKKKSSNGLIWSKFIKNSFSKRPQLVQQQLETTLNYERS